MSTTRAFESLHDPAIGGVVDMEEMLQLCRRAGLTEDEAQRAATQRGLDRLRRNESA